ncbi:MAG: hypothetical protein ABJB11_02615 [Ferruginibacter sp.]
MRNIFFPIIFMLLFTACKKQKHTTQNGLIPVMDCINFSTSNGTITCCLDSVINDSRCPANVNCIYAGSAAARFKITKNSKQQIITLSLKPVSTMPVQYSTEEMVLGYKISFTALTPYPGLAPYNYADYKAELTIVE